jgi:large subunit ribosomal protein L35
MPRLNVQTFTSGERLVTVVVVDVDVPDFAKDSFTHRCHFVASNIPLSPTHTSIALQRIAQEDAKAAEASAKKIALPWVAPWAHKGSPYHRYAIFVLEQKDAQPLDVTKLASTKRDKFSMRGFVQKHSLSPITATLFRTQWDESMAGVMERAGLKDQVAVELKRKRIEPLPYKRRTERMR